MRLELVALVYVLCEWAFQKAPRPMRPRTKLTRDQVLDLLQSLPERGVATYEELFTALQSLDTWAQRMTATGPADDLTQRVLLDGLGDGIHGTVQCWVRPVSAWDTLRVARRDIMKRQKSPPNCYPRGAKDALRYLGAMWLSGPGVSVERVRPPRHLVEDVSLRLGRVAEGQAFRPTGEPHFRIGLAPLLDRDGARFALLEGGGTFSVDFDQPLSNPAAIDLELDAILDDAERFPVDVLLLPELAVSQAQRDRIAGRLKKPGTPLLLVAAGSFHFWRESPHRLVNETVVLQQGGGVLWHQEKRGYFRVAAKDTSAFRKPLGVEASDEVEEGIQPGDVLRILDLPLGRIAVVICADFIAAGPTGFTQMLEAAAPDFVLVLAMTRKSDSFHSEAQRLADKFGISTVMVNAAHPHSQVPDSDLGLAYLAIHQPEGRPPTRAKWTREDRTLKVVMNARKAIAWSPVSDATAGYSVASGSRLCVLDLGVHFQK